MFKVSAGPRNKWLVLLGVTALVTTLGIALPSSAASPPSASKPPGPLWLDSGASTPARVNALLAQMTMPEKVGQMASSW